MAPPCLTLSATDTRRSFYDTILTQARANGGRTYGLRERAAPALFRSARDEKIFGFWDTFGVPPRRPRQRRISCDRIAVMKRCELSGGISIDLSSVFAFPSTLGIERIELHEQTVMVLLHAISPTAPCPRC